LSAGGNIIGTDVTLNFEGNGQGSILNTGTITASDTLKVDTPTLTNEANQVDVGQIWSKVKGGYVDTTGTEVQPGGYMSAANMDLNVQTLNQIGGALQKLNADGTVDEAGTQQMLAALQQQLGGSFTQMSVSDNLHTSFTAAGGFGVAKLMAIVVAVAAAIAMQPEISAEIGTLAGATAGSGTLMAAAAGTVGAGIGNVALSAAITGLASSSLSQLISTGNIDFGSVFETAGVAALTAGLLNGITYSPSAGLGFSTTASNNSLAALAGIQPSIGGGLVPTASSTIAQLPTQALAIAGEATVQAAVQSTIEGGSFLKALEDSAINDAAAAAAFDIGEAKTTLTTDFGIGGGDALYIVLHGALGCAASAAEGTGCAGGAIGGAAGAFLNTTVDANGNIPAPLDVAMTTMVGGLIAGALGANAQGAATAAENETLNNWLNHVRPGPMQLSEQERSDAALAACNAGDAASCNTYKSLQAASQQRDADLANACSGGFGSAGCRAQVAAALAGGNEVQSVNGAMYAFDPSAPAIKAVGDPYQSTYANSFDGQLAQSTLDGIQMAPIPLTGVGVFGKIGSWLGFGTADAGRLSGPMATVLDGAGGAINNGLAGSVANANFAQSSINAAGTFSVEGAAKYTQLAGVPISTVDDLAAAIKNGLIKPSQLPVDYVVTADGAQLILNTRTSVALSRAGVPQSRWYGVNQTGIQVPGMPAGITFNDLAAGQLARNKLPPTGTPNLP
jgi:filamentous hemagglutinin